MLLYYSGLENSLTVRGNGNFTFANNTTYGLGGKARVAYMPKNILQAQAAFCECSKQGGEFFVLGNGSNVLASDKAFDGNVISTKRLDGIIRQNDNKLFCLAGTKISVLLNYCRDRQLGGLEYLYGIPATIGGAAYMNAGVAGFSIGNNVAKVLIYDGKKRYLNQNMCDFAYRHSTMRDIKCIILAVIVKVKSMPLSEIEYRTDYFKQRRKHLPKGRSCGCVFKNPKGFSAGALIEQANLKGASIGSAFVSPDHANFIINNGSSAKDVKALIDLVKQTVRDKFGVELVEEVVYIGDFNGTDC